MSILKRKSKQSEMPEQPSSKSNTIMAAYDVMKKARKKKMAQGGPVKAGDVESHPSDEEDRGLNLFDGMAERVDPLDKELEEDKDSDDIVSRIMRKMRRK